MSDISHARHRAEMPIGTGDILSSRTLATAHAYLDQVLKPGQSVMDIGCGNGAITRGIAQKVGPEGRVLGLDVNARLIEDVRERHRDVSNLSFDVADIYDLSAYLDTFDIVTSARVLQWLDNPKAALIQMMRATVPQGRVIVLDYNHEKIAWDPDPPESARRFYQAFLKWRADVGMDNQIADHLASLYAEVGLSNVTVTPQHETTRRGDPDFDQRISIWAQVMASRGHQMVADGVISEEERADAERQFREWAQGAARSQTMYLLCVDGMR